MIIAVMPGAINFYDEPGGHAGKIRDVGSNRHLPPKVRARNWKLAQPAP
jgi:hypothetical protein